MLGGSEPVLLGAKLQRRLLTALALRAGEPRSVDVLCEALWPDEPPVSAVKLLRIYVSQLRKILPEPAHIVTGRATYALDVGEGSIDAQRFERLVAEAQEAAASGNAELAAALFGRALSLWRGPAYGEFADEEFARFEASRLEELRLFARERWHEARLELGAVDELLPEVLALAAAQPLRERAQRNAMVALYRAGRQSEALDAYAGFRRNLADELGLEPSPALRELQRRILQHDPALSESRGVGARRVSMPAPANPLVGRKRELAQLRQLLTAGEARLIALTGAGGAGKTRLALELARELASEFANGAAFVSLVSLTDPALVPLAIATELSVEHHEADPLDALADAIRDQELLIVVDNFEHVRAAAPGLVELLAAAPRLKLLVTSRVVPHLSGEHVYRLGPLSLEAAGELFTARAAAADRNAKFEEEAEAITLICARVDGLPLAVELAAARARTLTPQELLTHLDTRLPQLAGGPHDLPAHQRTLWATIEWSHELLDDEAQLLFRRLSVFAGSCALAEVEKVCSGHVDVLERLIDHSLITRMVADGRSRFTMLETVREFAWACLQQAGEAEETSRRHAEHFASLAAAARPALLGGEQANAVEWFSRELDEIRVALDWSARSAPQLELQLAAATGHFWIIRGYFKEGRQRLEHALAATREPAEARATALHEAALLARIQLDFPRAQALAEEGVALSRRLGDQSGVARSLNALTAIAGFGGNWEEARTLSKDSHELALFAGDDRTAAFALFNLADAALFLGRFADAQKASADALRLFRRIQHMEGVALALGIAALAAVEGGHRDEARQAIREGLPIAADLGFPEPLAWCLEAAAALARPDERAAKIAGAAERVGESLLARPLVQGLHQRTLDSLSERLKADRLDDLASEGRQISRDQAVKLALDILDEVP